MAAQVATLLWTGPVSRAQVGAAVVPGGQMINITCTGDGAPPCSALARSLDELVPGTAPVVLAGFSAGGQLIKRVLLDASDRARVVAVYLADATYTTGNVAVPPDEGFVLYALDAVNDPGKLMVSTASAAANKAYPTGIATQALLRAEIERRTGKTFESVQPSVTPFRYTTPAASKVWRLGGVWFAEYPTVPHGEQVTKLAGQVWKAMVLPWLDGAQEPVEPAPAEPGFPWGPVALVAGVGLGYAAWRWLR